MPLHTLRAAMLALSTALTVAAQAQGLPAEVDAALQRARVPRDAVAMLVVDADGSGRARLSHRADVAVNPASVMKLVTTYAALDLLGPAYTWSTPVYVEGAVRDGTLYGNLYIRGLGDPKLVVERMWLLLRRVQGLGVRTIEGDIVLDHGAFAVAGNDPASFDGEPLRPYNVGPDALLLNYKSVVMTFVPDRTAQSASVQYEPPLAGVAMQPSVPLVAGECADWRASLKAEFADPTRIRFAGGYPAACGERVWPLAYADPRSYSARAIEGLWLEMGGRLRGSVRAGSLPASIAAPVFELPSPTLAEVVRDINKFSNNVMAQQVFLTLGLAPRAGSVVTRPAGGERGTFDAAREVLRRWWLDRFPGVEPPIVDNGSGLSRQERISAQALARMLQAAYQSPAMPDLIASLPLAGVDGTMRRNRSRGVGQAHLKTGSLRDVAALAGYVHSANGRRQVLVAIVNHPSAAAARPAFDALLEWALREP